MFKNRMYVYGLGVGLIVGAILLQLMIVSKEASNKYSGSSTMTGPVAKTPLEEMDLQKLKTEAGKSFQVFDKNEKVYTQADFDTELQKRLKEETDKLGAATPVPTKRTYVYIQPNLTATTVAELLYKAEIVKDLRALTEELHKQNATNKIQSGFHLFEGTPDVQQVIQNLITEP